VGKLKEELEKYSDDTLVVSQRVEDVYYEKHGWETIKKPNPMYKEFDCEYTPVWSVCHYLNETDGEGCLYLDLHY
jgi:hypothetical protein